MENELRHGKELWEAVIEGVSEALFIYDPQGRILYKNAEAKRMYPEQQENYWEIYSILDVYDLEGNVVAYETLPMLRANQGEKAKQETLVFKRQGKERIVEISTTPIYDKCGRVIMTASFHRNITEAYMNQKKVKEYQEKRLQYKRSKIDALERAVEMKDEFLSLISHEFRTPINIIHTALQVLEFQFGEELPDKIQAYLKIIRQNNFRQLRLANNLLDIMMLDDCQFKLSPQNVEVVGLIRNICGIARDIAMQKGIRLSFKTKLQQKFIMIDPESLERILFNLLSNAIKFTPEGKTIKVGLSVVEEKLRLIVEDTGIGIPQNKRKLIFERFGQVDGSFSRYAEGVGIGLHLVKQLLEILDGSIIIENTPGGGSRFIVFLPIIIKNAQKFEDNCRDHELIPAQSEWISKIANMADLEFSDIYL